MTTTMIGTPTSRNKKAAIMSNSSGPGVNMACTNLGVNSNGFGRLRDRPIQQDQNEGGNGAEQERQQEPV